MESHEDTNQSRRIKKEIQTTFSPKYTEMKTGARVSRFGRPQKETKQDANSIPTELAKFVSKHSPKRLKPKDSDASEICGEDSEKILKATEDVKSLKENIPMQNEESNEFPVAPKVDAKAEISLELDIVKEKVKVKKEVDKAPIVVKQEPECNIIDVFIQKQTSENQSEDDMELNGSKGETSDDDKGKQDFSDTDSALGSAGSCHDTKSNKGEEFIAGQILWGSFNRSTWYPVMVYPKEDGSLIDCTKGKNIHVKYFNYNGYTALIPTKNVFEFRDIDDFFAQIAALNIKKSKVKSFAKSVYKAMEEALFFKQYPIDERIKVFDDILMHQLSTKTTSRKSYDGKHVDGESSRAAERRSIDSALDSPTPASPQYGKETQDPILCYLRTMEQYDAMNSIEPKKERKRSTSVRVLQVKQEPKDLSTDAIDPNRRKSSRAVKKRKFSEYEQDFKVEIHSKLQIESPAIVEPKAKRQKLLKEETLEERFLIDTNTLRATLRSSNKKRICVACLENNAEQTFKCSGTTETKCSGWFHAKCSASCESKREEIRFQCGDADEIIQTQTMKTVLVCTECEAGSKKCFICTEQVEAEDKSTQQCPNQDCRLAFHKDCLKLWPQNMISRGSQKRNNQCPQHTCHTCFSKDIHNSGSLAKCVKCPSAYHLELACVPAGSIVLSQTQIICPRHPDEKELQLKSKDKNANKPINIDWCNMCLGSGNLVCCESCPSAFHPDCIGYEESDDQYICQECQEGRLPLYNTIVWARVGAYRWWPGLIMPEFVLPDTVSRTRKSEREFCIRFFGSYDYFWFTSERVFQYDGIDLSVKGGSSRLDSAFQVALDEAHQMSEILATTETTFINAKPKPYTKLLMNRPIHPVKLRKADEHHEICSCKQDDPDPCGRSSDCINMHLNFECDKVRCPAKENCRNQKLRNREYADLKIVKTTQRGFGAISGKDIPEGTFVIEYVGELIDTVEMNRRMEGKLKNKEKEFYFLTIEGDLYVDAEPGGNLSRFINHSCEPNCNTRKITVDGNTRIGIFTNTSVKAGTELTFDYQMEFVGNKKTACFCGSKKCSGLIGEKLKEIKKEKKVKKRNWKVKAFKGFSTSSSGTVSSASSTSSRAEFSTSRSRKRPTLDESSDPIMNLMDHMVKKPKQDYDVKNETITSGDLERIIAAAAAEDSMDTTDATIATTIEYPITSIEESIAYEDQILEPNADAENNNKCPEVINESESL